MSNFIRTQPDATWLGPNYTPSRADWIDLGRKIHQSVNGDRGGAHAPATPIAIAGSGLVVTGRLKIAFGGVLTTNGTGRVRLGGASDWPEWSEEHPYRGRKILHSMLGRIVDGDQWYTDLPTASVRSLALSTQTTDGSILRRPATIRLPLRVHDGATLSKVTITFRIPQIRTRSPTGTPLFRVIAVDAGGVTAPLKSTTKDTTGIAGDRTGWAGPVKPSSADAWVNGGAAQIFEYICDQNNIIDIATRAYWLELIEEPGVLEPVSGGFDGTFVREQKLDVRCATTVPIGTTAFGAYTADGVVVANGDRVLVKNGATVDDVAHAYVNGIWLANTGGVWKRAPDNDQPADFSPGSFVRVAEGDTQRGSFWEIAPPYPVNIDDTTPGATWPIRWRQLTPQGNTYHSALVEFTNIADMRPQ